MHETCDRDHGRIRRAACSAPWRSPAKGDIELQSSAQEMPVTETLIELAHVRKIFREGEAETAAVRDVSLTTENGEFVAIIGTSGSGKSTL